MKSLITLLVAGLSANSIVNAHMQLSNPYPIDSPLNPQTPEALKDYSYTSPLVGDGSNYPCKGYHTQTPVMYTAQYTAGQSSSISLSGSATHGGGSCQISLSYDNGATFKVIESIMGGCPLTATYPFTIPSYAPAGNALLAWTWFNKIGNREIYMDCAWVQIANGASKSRRKLRRDTSAFNSLPNIFLANIPQAGGVTTIEGDEVTFPYPGSNILYGGSISSSSPLGQGYSGTPPAQSPGNPSNAPGSTPATSPPATAGNSPTATAIPTDTFSTSPASSAVGVPFPNTTTVTTITVLPTPPAASTTIVDTPVPTSTPSSAPVGSCSPGTLVCPSPDTFALCYADHTPSTPQAVAPGTQCANGMIITADNSGPCTAPPTQWLCRDNGNSFSACSNGYWVNMGSVAPGTICKDGAISAA